MPGCSAPRRAEPAPLRSHSAAALKAALATLPPDQHEVVSLSYLEGLSHSEISERLGVPLGTVKSRMRLAYQKIREAVEDLETDQ